MTLTTVIGSSGSGKTTFLQDVYQSHKCTYIRQYHNMRPYLSVSNIPSFDPTQLPFWDIYVKEGIASTIRVGGTMAGQPIRGLSGGQRKLLLFEIICQRCVKQQDMLIILDEPFSGVTDDFIPFMVERLIRLSCNHNLLIVTNDHVETLTNLADNTIKVSAIDRQHVCINNGLKVDRVKAIAALSLGGTMEYKNDAFNDDLKFFLDVEVLYSIPLISSVIMTIVSFLLLIVSFWNSKENMTSLVVLGAGQISMFCSLPYIIALVDWRISMQEEAKALVHRSKNMNKILKTVVTFIFIIFVTMVQFLVMNVVVEGLDDIKFFIAVLFDFLSSMAFYGIALGIYTNLSAEDAQILRFVPFFCMIFFSTTFSPGSGLPLLKALRYLFPRFYFWCMLPVVDGFMEGCPSDDTNLVYLVLSSFVGILIFGLIKLFLSCNQQNRDRMNKTECATIMDAELELLQLGMYGKTVLNRLQQVDQTNITLSDVIYETKEYIDEGRVMMEL
jgi:ABC-type lipoprotein export system ATPase subunit/heme/copper-type cytochrome/quinol oxidase subunit 4